MEKLSDLFNIKTNKYYFELYSSVDFGYFTFNGEIVDKRTLIHNNSYIIDFIVTSKNSSSSVTKMIDYVVSVEDEEAYAKKCQITLTFKTCYH